MTAPRHERGIALVIVLWVGLLVVAIAGAFIVDTRNSTRLTRNFLDNAEARALADGGVHLAIFELVRSDTAVQWQRDGRLYRRVVPGGTLEIAIEDEAGKIDLNSAGDELLEGLFRSAGVPTSKIEAVVDAIMESRQQISKSRNERRSRKRAASGTSQPRAFNSVDSLGQVPGMTADLHAQLRPALTVFGDRKLYYLTSPREALLAIPGVTADAVDTFLSGRAGEEVDDPLDEFLFEGRAREFWRKGKSKFVTVKVMAQSENGAKFVRIAIVELARKDDRPFIVKEWREGDALSIWRHNRAPVDSVGLSGGAT
jgi:general secretion pathway protein K